MNSRARIICLDNLDEGQKEALKQFWLSLMKSFEMSEDFALERSLYAEEMFEMVGNAHPDSVVLRWLRARKWHVDQALEQFLKTLQWRIDWGVRKIVANGENALSVEEFQTGKSYYLSFDRKDHPICYVSAKDHVKGQFPSESSEKLTVFAMEMGRKLLKYPNESVTVIFDLTDFAMKNMDYQHVKFLIKLLENYYPESLAQALIVNAPWVFNSCWSIIKRWMDPNVEQKFHFIKNFNDLYKYVDPSSLPKRFNGTLPDFRYIPPDDEEKRLLSVIHRDHLGRTKALKMHHDATEHFLRVNWQFLNDQHNLSLIEHRNQSIEQLKYSYEQTIPYRTTLTHYHRAGFIQEPIFLTTYQNIQQQQEQISFF